MQLKKIEVFILPMDYCSPYVKYSLGLGMLGVRSSKGSIIKLNPKENISCFALQLIGESPFE